MKIKKVKYFTFLLVSFLMTKIFCNSPIEMSENNYSFELQYNIERIEKIKSQLKEKNLQTEINYLRFLEQQIKMITEEIRLNKLRDKQQYNEINYYASQHASTKDWKDSRDIKSPTYFHNIDYHKLFEEQQ